KEDTGMNQAKGSLIVFIKSPSRVWILRAGFSLAMIAMLALTFTGRGRGEPALTSFTTIDVPGATATQAFGINESGQIVGTYVAGPIGHSFLLSEGIFTTIEVPGATSITATGINDSGQIVGFYQDPTGVAHGFLLSQGIFTTIDAPHLSTGTLASGIND